MHANKSKHGESQGELRQHHQGTRRNRICARVKLKQLLFRQRHRQHRPTFSRKYKHWSAKDWERVVWSDGNKYMLYSTEGMRNCWKEKENRNFGNIVKHVVAAWWYGDGYVPKGLDACVESMAGSRRDAITYLQWRIYGDTGL